MKETFKKLGCRLAYGSMLVIAGVGTGVCVTLRYAAKGVGCVTKGLVEEMDEFQNKYFDKKGS
jgi:hypothetical protein